MKKYIKSAFLAACISLGGYQAQAADTIKIGQIVSLTGPAAPFGVPSRDAIKMLVDKVNGEGGVAGKQIELVVFDDQSNPTEAARGANKLIRQDQVSVILGASTGSSTLALAPIAMNNEVPVIAPVGSIGVTARENAFWPWVFRICPTDRIMVNATMERGVFEPGHKKIAIMYQEDAYGEAGMKYTTSVAAERDLELVAAVGAPANAIDLSAAATRIRTAEPDVIMLQTAAPALSAAFVRAAKEVGITAPIIGGGSTGQRPFIDAAGPAAEGIQVVAVQDWSAEEGKQRKLRDLLEAAGMPPRGYGEVLGASALEVALEAIRRVEGDITGSKIRDALETIEDFDGSYYIGKVSYSKDQHEGIFEDSIILMKVENGDFVRF